jgi:hypothetical protein
MYETPESSPQPRLVGRRANRMLVVAAPAAAVLLQLGRPPTLAVVPSSLWFGAGAASAILAIEWVIVRMLARSRAERLAPALPYAERWSEHPRPWIALGVFALLTFAAREHFFGHDFVLTYEHHTAHTETDWDRDVHTTWQAVDGPPPSFADRPIRCSLFCNSRDDAVCDGIADEMGCTHDDYEPDAVEVDIRVHPTGASCSLFPLSHSGELHAFASGHVHARDEYGTRISTFSVRADLERTAFGFHSCYELDVAQGRSLGAILVGVVREILEDE